MTRRSAGTFSALGVLAVLAAVVALAAQAGTVAQRGAPTAKLHAADDSEIHGAVSLLPTPVTGGTTVAVTVHGLPANARVDVRLHTGRSLAHVSSGSTALPSGTAGESGSFRAYGPVRSRAGADVRITDVTDGAHMVLVHANDSLVAYAHIPRG
jgi:hypothetical protein